MSTQVFSAHRFDGRLAVAVPVCVRLEDEWLIVEGLDQRPLDREPVVHAQLTEFFAHAPRIIALRSGATLEVRDVDGSFAAELERAGLRPSRVVRLQAYWPAAILAVACVIALCVTAYLEVVPRVAEWAAFKMSPELEERMGRSVLKLLDETAFAPSRLEPQQRSQITEDFARAAARVAPGVGYRLEFRSSATYGINAFTLPGNIIVLLDATVDFAHAIDHVSLLGVLGHELGHVMHKHVTRELLQSMGIGAIGSLLWGDFSAGAAGIGVVIADLSYSRSFETEADEFALQLLRAGGHSADPLARFFSCLSKRPETQGVAFIPEYMSSHPSTDSRLEHLRALDSSAPAEGLGCPTE